MLPQPVGLEKLKLNLFFMRGASTYIIIFIKYALNIDLCPDTYKLICVKLGRILGTTKFCSLILVWVMLMFTQGHCVMGKIQLAQLVSCKVAGSN